MCSYIAARLFKAPVGRMFDVPQTDEALIARVGKRDKRALELLYDKHSSVAMGLAVKMTGDPSVAEEIVQEAFWRVWKRAGTFDAGRGKFTAWLSGIVHNLAIDELRRRKSGANSSTLDLEDDSVAEIADEREDVAESVLQKLTGDNIRAALAILPALQRNVIELAYFDGLTHQEIADKLGEPIGTIHTRARLGIQKLREQLAPMFADDANVGG